MSITIVTPPASEPLSLAEAKLFLRIDQEDEDDLLAGMIGAAREAVEAASGRALITRRVIETLDQWSFDARGAQALALAPVTAVAAIRVAQGSGDLAALDADRYRLDAAASPPRVFFPAGAPPAPASSIAGIEIEYDAGYGASAGAIPQILVQAVRLTLAAAYEDRDGAIALPAAARALIAAVREPRL